MKRILLPLAIIWVAILFSCHETTIGYLETKDASYDPDTLYIYKNPDPIAEAVRIENNAPWVSFSLQGYEGTEPIIFSVESVTSDQGEEAAATFKSEISIRGGGALMYPLENKAVPGTYVVAIRLTNPGYSHVIEKAMTFIVVE